MPDPKATNEDQSKDKEKEKQNAKKTGKAKTKNKRPEGKPRAKPYAMKLFTAKGKKIGSCKGEGKTKKKPGEITACAFL